MRWGALSIGTSAVTALLIAAVPAVAAPAVAGEFPLPAGETVGSDNEIVAGPDGNMWVTTETNTVVRINPGGSMDAFPVVADAFGITVGADDKLWASQPTGVVRINPANGNATQFPIAGGYADGRGITSGPDGKIWVISRDRLTSIDPGAPDPGAAAAQDVNVITTSLGPRGMTTGSDGLLWFADGPNVVSATAADTPVLTSYAIGNSTGGAQDVGAGLNGQVAYANPVDDPQGVGLISPGVTPLKTNLENSDPFGVAFGADQAYWIARSATNDLLRLAPDGTTTTLTGFAASGGVGPRKIAAGPGNTLWVTLDTPEKIGRVSGVDPSAPPADPPVDPPVNPPAALAPTVEITSGPDRKVETKGRAKVKFEFTSATAGASFECSLKKKGKTSDAEEGLAEFGACGSPKKYKRLRLGRYKFRVRAAAGGLTGTADAQRFKVVAK